MASTDNTETNAGTFIERLEEAYKQALTVDSLLEVLYHTDLVIVDEGHLNCAIGAIVRQSDEVSTMLDSLACSVRNLNTAERQTKTVYEVEYDTHCDDFQKAYELIEMAVEQRGDDEEGRRETLIEEAYRHMIAAGESMSDMQIGGAS